MTAALAGSALASGDTTVDLRRLLSEQCPGGCVNPSSKAIREFLIHQGELWNDSQRDAMMAVYRDIAPNGLQMELPVGAPAQRGWESMEMLWDNYQSTTRVSYPVIAVADNGEAAVLPVHVESVPVEPVADEFVDHVAVGISA